MSEAAPSVPATFADDKPERPVLALVVNPVSPPPSRRSRHPVLTSAQEATLGRRIAHGRLAERRLHECQSLEEGVRADLARQVSDGRVAFAEFARHNIRLVGSVAARYRSCRSAGLDFEDLLQEGWFGLHRAIQKWDHTRGLKFSTYAVWWIRQSIQRAIVARGRTVRLPTDVDAEIRQIRRAEHEVRAAGLTPTPATVAASAGLDEGRVGRRWPWREPVESLDRLVDGDDPALDRLVADPESAEPDVVVGVMLLRDDVDRALRCLKPQEAEILRRRFGLDGGPETLEEVGRSFGVSRERIRQIQNRAMEKLVTVGFARTSDATQRSEWT